MVFSSVYFEVCAMTLTPFRSPTSRAIKKRETALYPAIVNANSFY